MATYIYTRVSTVSQTTAAQEYALSQRFPGAPMYCEVAPSWKKRPKLEELLAILQPGDTLAIAALDRLGRRASEIISLIETLHGKGIAVYSEREKLDYSTPVGRLICQIMISFSEMERALLRERLHGHIKAKHARGYKFRGNPKFSEETLAVAREMKSRACTLQQISDTTGISVPRLVQIFRQDRTGQRCLRTKAKFQEVA